MSIEGMRGFVVPVGFYKRFIKDFSKITQPLCKMLEKESKFQFDGFYMISVRELKKKLIAAPINIAPGWVSYWGHM